MDNCLTNSVEHRVNLLSTERCLYADLARRRDVSTVAQHGSRTSVQSITFTMSTHESQTRQTNSVAAKNECADNRREQRTLECTLEHLNPVLHQYASTLTRTYTHTSLPHKVSQDMKHFCWSKLGTCILNVFGHSAR